MPTHGTTTPDRRRIPLTRGAIASAIVAVFALAWTSHVPSSAQAPRAPAPIVGTWQVVEWWVQDGKSGDRQYPYGRQPAGYFVYDSRGHVLAQVARATGDALGEGRWRSLSHDDLRRLVEQQVAYFGTYSVDTAKGVLTEHVDHDLARERAGAVREVPFRIDGDRLILGDGTSWQAVLMRAY